MEPSTWSCFKLSGESCDRIESECRYVQHAYIRAPHMYRHTHTHTHTHTHAQVMVQ